DLFGKAARAFRSVDDDKVSEDEAAKDEIQTYRFWRELRKKRRKQYRGGGDSREKGEAMMTVKIMACFQLFAPGQLPSQQAISEVERPDRYRHCEGCDSRKMDAATPCDKPRPQSRNGRCIEREKMP